MKTVAYKENSLRGKILCSLFGHKFVITRQITNHFREFECRTCHLQLTNDATGHRISLTQEHLEINDALLNLHRHRQATGSRFSIK